MTANFDPLPDNAKATGAARSLVMIAAISKTCSECIAARNVIAARTIHYCYGYFIGFLIASTPGFSNDVYEGMDDGRKAWKENQQKKEG